ncbi:type 4b pilus protein PilO2 [Parachitinimonas caeni]|uniref:Type 4b pilus protein PilO2 n=1 Tax=Parachitinimonas caeni TaxID=3031301 RepID=A0ABT7E322_9NEIS|nr:type 4b pilus protein PilO2 [Parachitinimonas caeni]MDK2126716.1 type 4b pilus protein PilO2 [Parachitinimonas caeni]
MATHLLIIDRTALLLGLEWRGIVGRGRAELPEARRYARELAASHALRLQTRHELDGDEKLDLTWGYLPAESVRPRGKPLAGAALFSASISQRLALLLWRLEDGQVWLAGIVDGHPSPTFDAVLDAESAQRLASQFISMPGHHDCALYGNAPDLLPGNILQAWSAGEALEGMGKAGRQALQLQALSPLRRHGPWLGALAAIALLGMGVKLGWQHWQAQRGPVPTQPALTLIDPLPVYQRTLAATAAGWRQAPAEASALLARVRQLPLDVGGWQLQEVQCQPTCVARYHSEPMATYATFKPGQAFASFEFTESGIAATLDSHVNATPTIVPEKIPMHHDWQINGQSRWQTLSYIGVMVGMQPLQTNSPVIALPPPPKNAQYGPLPASVSPIYRRAWQLSGPLALLSGVIQRLPEHAVLTQFTASFSGGNPAFTLKGELYVRN